MTKKWGMKFCTEGKYTLPLVSVFIAYCRAVSSASFVFTIFMVASLVWGFESSTTYNLSTKILHFSGATALAFILGWIYAFSFALIPFVVGIAAARIFNTCHWLYFLLGGVITAAGLCFLYISIPNLGINVPYPEPPLLARYLKALPIFITCGAIAGAMCWRYLSRNWMK